MVDLRVVVEGMELDISDSEIVLDYVFSDLTELANITTDYSTSFTVKGTQNNNAIFGQIFHMDRYIWNSTGSNVGYNFNPSKRADTIIYLNGQILKKGYLKMDSITIEEGVVNYKLVFYSEVAKILRSLKEYNLVDCGQLSITAHRPDKDYILSDWSGTSANFNTLRYIPSYQGTYNNFTSNLWLTDNSTFENIVGELNLDEAITNEYRASYQMPALKINSTINAIVSEWNDNNDSQIQLGSWFNSGNTYWTDSVFTLGNLSSEKSEVEIADSADTLSVVSSGTTGNSGSSFFVLEGFSTDFFKLTDKMSYCNLDLYTSKYRWNNINGLWYVRSDFQGELTAGTYLEVRINYPEQYSPWNEHSNFPRVGAIWTSGGTAQYYTDKANSTADNVHLYISSVVSSGSTGALIRGYIVEPIDCEIIHNKSVNSKSISAFAVAVPNSIRLYSQDASMGRGAVCIFSSAVTSEIKSIEMTGSTEEQITTGSLVSKSDLIDSELKQGDVLIDFCKLFGLVFDFDEDNNLHIISKEEYFNNPKLLDWTDKVDYSQTIEEQPVPFEKRYYTIGYTPNSTYYEEHYSDKYDANYGEAKYDTGYEFASDENAEEMFESIYTTTICSKESGRFVVDGAIRNYSNDKVLPAFFAKSSNERTNTSTKYSLLFDNGVKTPVKDMYVTNDTIDMYSDEIDNAARCWIDCASSSVRTATSAVTKADIYRQYTTLSTSGNCSFDIGYPRENYAGYTTTTYPSGATIYNKYWSRYIGDVWNVNNKILKCKVWLTPVDMLGFSFKNFVLIDNCLYHVNEIQWNPMSDESTTVTLIRVKDLGAYTNRTTYNVGYNMRNATYSNKWLKVSEGSSFSTTITPAAGYKISELYGSMNGVFMPKSGNTIYTSAVTGDITIVATTELDTTTILYTSTDGEIVEPLASAFDAEIIENYYDEDNEQGYLVFSGNLTSIGEQAFSGCTTLETIVIPSGVTELLADSFAYCSSLKYINIPSGVTDIGARAFFVCRNLSAVTFPDTIEKIDTNAFRRCYSLKSVALSNMNINMGENVFALCSGLTSADLSIRNIPTYCFSACTSLSSVTLSNTDTIGWGAFRYCTSLTAITLPNSVVSIGTNAFRDCYGLTSINLSSVTDIGEATFFACSSLTSVDMSSLNTIGERAFWGYSGTSLQSVICAAETIPSQCFESCSALTSVTLTNTKVIEQRAFGWSGLRNVVLPSTIESVGYAAFYECNDMEEMTIYATTPPTLGTYAFWGLTINPYPIYVPSIDDYTSQEAEEKGWGLYSERLAEIV